MDKSFRQAYNPKVVGSNYTVVIKTDAELVPILFEVAGY